MKKLTAVFSCLALILSLCACAASRLGSSTFDHAPVLLGDPSQETEKGTDQQTRDQPYTPTTAPASGGDLVEETWSGQLPEATPADLILDAHGEVSQESWPVLTEEETAGGYVRLYNHVRIDYVDAFTQEPYAAYYIVPELTMESADAKACNQEIREVCDPIVEKAIGRAETSPAIDVTIDYDAWYQRGVVSLCVNINSSFGTGEHLVYTLDAETGELLDNRQVAALAGFAEDRYLESVRQAMLTCFEERSSNAVEDAFCAEQREKTIDDENLADVTLFLGDGGELYALARIYAIAGGAEYHWELVPVGTA